MGPFLRFLLGSNRNRNAKYRSWSGNTADARITKPAVANSEPPPSSWTQCKTCGHDMYVHAHIGYGGCLYGEGCECKRYAHSPSDETEQEGRG
jgi:hypothetical protein